MVTRILLILLSVGVLGTATGCYVDPAYGPPSVEFSFGASTVEPDYWHSHPRRDNWYDDGRYQARRRERQERQERWR
jgi:hypothetical protein